MWYCAEIYPITLKNYSSKEDKVSHTVQNLKYGKEL